MCRMASLPSTVSHKPTILVELLFMPLDISSAIDTRTKAILKQTQVHSNRAEPMVSFLRQKFVILISCEL